jgi:hypothetical protein
MLFTIGLLGLISILLCVLGVRRVLHNGDLVSLVNPEFARPGGVASEADLKAASFFVQICLPSRPVGTTSFFSGLQSSKGDSKQLHSAMRSATVLHLLEQDRNVFDYYDQKELLGSGANGQVYRCVHKLDGRECALKVCELAETNYFVHRKRLIFFFAYVPVLKSLSAYQPLFSFLDHKCSKSHCIRSH